MRTSLPLLTFLAVSIAGHAALLVPLSRYLPALFDNEVVQSDTVIVSISVISLPENKVEEQSETSRQAPPLHKATQPNHIKSQQTDQHNAPLEALSEDPIPASSERPILAAEPGSVEEPLTESKSESPPDTEPQSNNKVSRMQQSDELKARRHRQLRAEERYLAELLNAIARHRFYPKNARKKGHQGSVEIELVILKNGEFESVKIGKPSNYRSLNKATTRALNRLKRFKPFPSDIKRDSWHISIPFRYVLSTKHGNRS